MRSFKFVHAADLHLGSPFRGLAVKDAAVAAHFAKAVRSAFSALVQRAIDEKADFVVIAGDVYDGEWKDNTIGLFFNREVARLDRAGIPIFLLKGNHDADSVVTRSISLPGSVREFSTRKPTSFRLDGLDVALHGQGFADRAAADNLALTYPPAEPGCFNIGVLHTALTGRPPHDTYAPCTADDLRSRGYDYWALGHVHDFEIVADEPPIVFPGNLQGRNIRETGPKGAVLVSVEDGRVAAIDRLVVDAARWANLDVDIAGAEDFDAVLKTVGDALAAIADVAGERLVALRLHLSGVSGLRRMLVADRLAVADEIQAACHRAHPDIWLEKLEIRVTAPSGDGIVAGDLDFDLEAMVAQLCDEPQTAEQARALIAEVSAKLPAGIGAANMPLGVDAAELVSEARDVLGARLFDPRDEA